MDDRLREELGIEELRARFLEYTREAFRRTPSGDRPRILEVGCGRGPSMLELASLTKGEIVGIDLDGDALHDLERRIEQEDLSHRLTTVLCSLFDTGFADGAFDVVWEEGVLHLLDIRKSLGECSRLLKHRGHLVMAETTEWFESKREALPEFGFDLLERIPWRSGCWWTDYYAPLEERIQRLRETGGDSEQLEALRRYEDEVERVKADPDRSDTGHFVLRKTG